MGTTMDFEAAVAGEAPVNPPPSTSVFDDLEPPAEAFSEIDAKYGKQHVLIVHDTSGSMSEQRKIEESNQAKQALVDETAVPENKDGFVITEIPFSSGAERSVFAQSAVGLQLATCSAGGGTNFEAALIETKDAIEELENRPNPEGFKYYRPVVVFMSDGHGSLNAATLKACQEVADIIAIAFGDGADEQTLGQIASDGQVHRIGTNGGELSKFLAKVGKTLSDGFQAKRI